MLTADRVLDEYYLEVRCKLLEIAAILDRYDRSPGSMGFTQAADPRWRRCRESLTVLAADQSQPNRAEQIALIFSDHQS